MKSLFEFLSTKIQTPFDKDGFPLLPIFDDVIEFLKDNGFEIIQGENTDGDVDTYLEKTMRHTNVPVCIYETADIPAENLCWIRIRNIGDVNVNNPMLFFYVTLDTACKSDTEVVKLANEIEADYIAYNLTTREKYYTWKEFKKIFFKYFK